MSLAGRWPSISLALRLLPSDNDTIARGCRDVPRDCLTKVLSKWLQRGYDTSRHGPPTWQMLVAAVANSAGGDNPGLAKQIAENHQGEDACTPFANNYCNIHCTAMVNWDFVLLAVVVVFISVQNKGLLSTKFIS